MRNEVTEWITDADLKDHDGSTDNEDYRKVVTKVDGDLLNTTNIIRGGHC